jgi:nicotinamidase-related amidase
MAVKSALLVVDVITDFEHPDGDKLLASFAQAQLSLEAALASAREHDIPVVYANDNRGLWDGDREALVERALHGRGGGLVAGVVPHAGDRFLIKPRYSAFDLTPLELILSSLDIERVLLCGTTTEMCVAQTAIAARERGFKVSILVDACAHIDKSNASIALQYLERVVGAQIKKEQHDAASDDAAFRT